MVLHDSPASRIRKILLFSAMVAVSWGLVPTSGGALTVTVDSAAEGNDPASPNQVEFVVRLSGTTTTDTSVRYTTAADTAREGTDYEATRGVLTIPAGQTEGRVSVPLVADTRPEDAENFALIVWLDGQVPVPALTEISRPTPPAGGIFQWGNRSGGVSEGNWLHPNVLGRYGAAGWVGESFVAFPNGVSPVLKGPWVVWQSGVPGPALLNVARRSTEAIGEWETLDSLLLRFAFPAMRDFCSIAGDVAAVFSGWEVTLVRLHRHQPPEIIGRLPVTPPSYVWPPMQSPRPNATGFAFTGERLVVAIGEEAIEQQIQSEIRIYEPAGASGTAWTLKAVIPDAAGPFLAEGDTVVARSLMGGGIGSYRVYTRHEGGADHWGESGVIEVPVPGMVYDAAPMAMNGGLLLVPDLLTEGASSGKIHVFLRSPEGNSWSYAGAFASPQPAAEDHFGAGMALGGRDLLAVTPSLVFGSDKGWGGSFNGATVMITDDDEPLASLELPAVFEPSGGARVARGALVLSRESEEPVTFKWQTSDATALGGTDYTPAFGEVTIPAGSLFAPLEVTILPDTLTEDAESLKLTVTQISGARLTATDAWWTIRDTDRPAVVRAEDIVCAEGAPPVSAVVNLFPVAEPLTVNVKAFTPVIADHAGPVTDFDYAVPGVDWAGTPATFHAAAATPGQGLLPLTGLQDTLEEGSRRGLLQFELPEGAVGASFSERLVHEPPLGAPHSFISYDWLTTDGKWAAAIRSTLEGQSVVIYRKGDAPGGAWTPWTTLPESVMDGGLPTDGAKLRAGRLVLHSAGTGIAKIFRPGPEGAADRQWVQEAVVHELRADHHDPGMPMDFDGESLVVASSSSRIVFVNRGAGDWTGRQHVDIPVGWSSGKGLSMTPGRLAIVRGSPVNATVHILERMGTGAAPWRLDPEARIDLPEGTLDCALWTCGNVLVLDQKIYRRRDDGGWTLEQTIPDIVRGLDRGVLIGSTAIYADVGPPGAPWRVVGQPDSRLDWSSSFEFNAGVVVTRTNGLPSVLKIMEAGMGLTILDHTNFELTPTTTVAQAEPRYAETNAVVQIVAEHAAPVDIPIHFETVPGGTATPDLDFRTVKGTVIIPAGARSGAFAIPILPDTIPELDETFLVNLIAPEFGRLTASTITVTISAFAIHPFTRPPVFVPEPASGEAVYQIPVTFSPASSTEVTATYRVAAGTAGAQDAFFTQEGTLSIPPGMATVLVPVTVYADALTEGPETLNMTLQTMGPYPITPLRFEVVIDDRASGGSEPDDFTAPQNSGIDFNPARNVLANDTSGHTMVSPSREPMHGTLTWREDGAFRYVPAANFIGTDRFAYTSQSFTLPAGAMWKWLNPRNESAAELTVPGFQANWMKSGFNDAAWQNGHGLMAYGGIGQGAGAVTIDTDISASSFTRYTAYFRTSLTFASQPSEGVAVEFICDDAAIFYLNGVEIGRHAKAPLGAFASAPDTYTLLAPNALNDTEENQIQRLHFPTARFAAGDNLFAISVHNAASTSSDLGLKIINLTPGNFTTPTWVTVNVTDAHLPPVLQDDLYVPPVTMVSPWNSPVLDSRLIRSSVYSNDGLLGGTGLPHDPILEAAIGGSAAASVTFEKDTGHFRLATPPHYYGTTGFTYRVRDKDGWSNTATVTITVRPSRSYDIWRAEAFGTDSFVSAGLPEMDEDVDGTANVFEYVFQKNPVVPDAPDPLQLIWNGHAWALRFSARPGFGTSNISLKLESSHSLAETDWTWLATLNDADGEGSLNRLAPGLSLTVQDPGATGRLYTVTLPPDVTRERYFRLRAVEEPTVLFP